MAVGKDYFPEMHPVPGFRLGIASAGVKTSGKKDLIVMEMIDGSSIAGVFTTNAFCAAPVQISKENIYSTQCRYLVINTGNANAGTGDQGRKDAESICQALAAITRVDERAVLPFSTGVIGEYLPVQKIISALPLAYASLSATSWDEAARSILTTDTRPKGASVQLDFSGKKITITGITKGSGMIRPNMATMLAYVATDAVIEQELLKNILASMTEHSFNRITVDGDMSTNDCAILVATGASGVDVSELSAKDMDQFLACLKELFIALAQQVVQDGEGATKFVTIKVSAGKDEPECLKVAYAVAESPLVKTALFASDPNWGRILAAIGYSGLSDLNVDGIEVYLDNILIAEKGGRAQSYLESLGQEVMSKDFFSINIILNRGHAAEEIYTTDLSYDYIKINAEYRS